MMSVKDIIAAQQRAAKASKKVNIPARPAQKIVKSTVDLLAQQRKTAAATNKFNAAKQDAPATAASNSVKELIAAQRRAAEADKAGKAAQAAANNAPKANEAIINKYKEDYKKFLAKLEKEIAAGEPMFFTPNIPKTAEAEPVVEVKEASPDVNGISVGEEAGGAVEIKVKPKRPRRPKKATVAPTVEPEIAPDSDVIVAGSEV